MSTGALSPEQLFDGARVHRSVYLDHALFALERRRLFGRTWQYIGHESQLPQAGDYLAADIAGQPVLLLRRGDGSLGAVLNRCAHKGSTLVTDRQGCAGRTLRCPYHGWSYRLDGSLIGVPNKDDYAQAAFDSCDASRGLTPVATAVHRGFVFVRVSARGPAFEDQMAPLLSVIDLIADRSPSGRLQVNGPCLRMKLRCNWKLYLENINDTLHVLTAHASAAGAAESVWSEQPSHAPKPMAIEQLLPFANGHAFFERMGGRVLPGGHSILGTQASIHSAYGDLGEYSKALAQAHGPERAAQVLAFTPQNVIFYPGVAMKASPLTIRVLRPLAADQTLLEVWALAPADGPTTLHRRGTTYNRLVFSPMSVVAHDDIHLWESAQRALAADGNEWVSLQRGWPGTEAADGPGPEGRAISGTDEALMRNQYSAWRYWMSLPDDQHS